jgi:hypothetical protein
MKVKIFFTVFCVCSLAGCSTNKEQIIFSDEKIRSGVPKNETVVAAPQKLEKQDQFKIDAVVFGYLLERHFWDDGEYSAVFLQGEDSEVEALIKRFPNHVPPIKTSDRVELRENRTPLDKDTDRPAIILSAEISDPTNQTVEAIGRWYAGGAVTGFYVFDLSKAGDDWVIQNLIK